jgi:hypothetical protein
MFTLRADLSGIVKDLAQLDGPGGPFFIGFQGASHPEIGDCFFYGDVDYQFFFYAHAGRAPDGWSAEIYYATLGRMGGDAAVVAPSDFPRIERNIEKCFRERRPYVPAEPLKAGETPARISFIWRRALERESSSSHR